MKSKSIAKLLAAVAVLNAPLIARADWPAKVFAPYMYIGAGDDFKLTDCDDACGQKYYTLAFFIARQTEADKDGAAGSKPKIVYSKEPTWDGYHGLGENLYLDQITAIRSRGGDVIASFGGADGKELAIIETDATALEAEYQAIIDKYKFTWLDFDIEGENLDKNREASLRRDAVIAQLQKKNPGLRITFTIPVDPEGISDSSQSLIADAAARGVKVYSVNLMVMFFGNKFINKGPSEGQLGIKSAAKAHDQIVKIDPAIQIGLCPCLGENGSPKELFTIDDAKTLKAFADKTAWVCSLHYWSINDDAGKPKHHHHHPATQPVQANPAWAFADILKSFTTAK